MGVAPPTPDQRFVFSDRNTLLFDGISTFLVDQGGIVRIERLITNYQKNPSGVADDSYLNAERMFQLAQVIRLIKAFQLSTFPRAIIVADNSPVPPNSSYVNTNIVRAAVVSYYQSLEAQGIVTDSVSFAAGIKVENSGGGVYSELLPITLPNQLELIAMKVQFRAA
jgi:phage tail sheath gpL-like